MRKLAEGDTETIDELMALDGIGMSVTTDLMAFFQHPKDAELVDGLMGEIKIADLVIAEGGVFAGKNPRLHRQQPPTHDAR
jgi:hypothetical protein